MEGLTKKQKKKRLKTLKHVKKKIISKKLLQVMDDYYDLSREFREERAKRLEAEKNLMIATENPTVTSVGFNGRRTTIIWSDGDITEAMCDSRDTYSKSAGFAIAYAKKFGGKYFSELLRANS